MSLAWYIVLQSSIPGFSQDVNGKPIARAGDMLEGYAKEAGVTPLMEFFSAAPDVLAAFAEDSGVPLKMDLPPERWFTADEGIITIRALIRCVEGRDVQQKPTLIEDLRDFEKVLDKAREHGIKWHLAVDF